MFKAEIVIRDGEHEYTEEKWIEGENIEEAREIAEKYVELENNQQYEYRKFRLKRIVPREKAIQEIEEKDGLKRSWVESQLDSLISLKQKEKVIA